MSTATLVEGPSHGSPQNGQGELRYQLLGPVTVCNGDGTLRLGGPKQRTVLASLLLNANRVVSEKELIALLWEDEPPTSARGQVQVRVWELRKLLGRSVIVRRSPGYLIEVRPGELDVQVFEDAVVAATADLAAGRARESAVRLREALELWQGPPLGGVTDALASRDGKVLEERRIAAWEKLFAAELAAGRHAQVVGELRRVSETYPFREQLQAHLMVALHRSGRASEALAVYTDTHRRFATELGIEPGRSLQELHLQILQGLDDQDDQYAVDEPAPAVQVAARVRPAELPFDVRGFAGRYAELQVLNSQLNAGSAADVWVVNGSAGVGKTALAVHWAWRVRERFPDGQLYVDLRGFDADQEPITPLAALGRLLLAIGVDAERLPADLDSRIGLYRSMMADRSMLLVLDNARDADQVLPLLPPVGTVVVTSRNRLGELIVRCGARSLPLGVLSAADSRAVLASVLGETQVRAEPTAVDELARLCGHLPLALRIAAANLTATPVPRIGELAAELAYGSPLRVLTVDGAEESPITRAFAVSYETLTPQLRQLFRRLGLIPGPDFTAPVAAALVDAPVNEVTRQLSRLAAAHLLEQHVPGRYRLHGLLRRYALDRAQGEENDQDRHAAWTRLTRCYLAWVDAAEARFQRYAARMPRDEPAVDAPPVRFGSTAEALAWLDSEHENLAALLPLAAERGPHPVAWYLADAVRFLFHHRGRRVEWLDIAPDVLAAARAKGEPRVEAFMLQSIGNSALHVGRRAQAIECLTEAARVHRTSDWLEGEASTRNTLGIALRAAGRLVEAREEFARALELHRMVGSRVGEMMVLNNLGYMCRQLGQLTEATEYLTAALALSAEKGAVEAAVLVSLGFVLWLRGNGAQAVEHLTRASQLHRDLGHVHGESFALTGLSLLAVDAGDYQQAHEYADRALELARQERSWVTEGNALQALARAELGLGRVDEAQQHQLAAVRIARASESASTIGEALVGLSCVHARRGEFAEALRAGDEALATARASGLRVIEARALIGQSWAHQGMGERDQAARLCRDGILICQQIGLATAETRAWRLLDQIRSGRSTTDGAGEGELAQAVSLACTL
ncbi:AfsR/SARP family transcriptional regulator [Goodfellowiella coeruleoviolacea]|nr:BTAD domain-containing putative transcriptional regulator [Goodfellowiella coeruleoviolacea]